MPEDPNGSYKSAGIALSNRKQPSYVVISGGTGANSIISAFGASPAFVLPVSDDGGSSAEILRCFGGPSIGDIRSRLIRLIPLPDVPSTRREEEWEAIHNLMAFRFPAESSEKDVRELWMEIVEGRSELWEGIGEDKKECIRAFLVHFQTLCLRRAHKQFSFLNFSLGNGFLTGARDLFGSLPSAIFLFKSIAGVNSEAQVIPAINTNQAMTIAAQLVNSTTIVGQCNISHPAPPVTPSASSPGLVITPIPGRRRPFSNLGRDYVSTSTPPPIASPAFRAKRNDSRTFDTDLTQEMVEELRVGNIAYRKGEVETPLEARIERIFYINTYGQEIFPSPNPEYLETLSQRDILVYSCGSLWTSIAPCLSLRGLATAIATSPSLKAKVLLLNSTNDRETPGYTALDYVESLVSMLERLGQKEIWQPSQFISHLVCLESGRVPVDHATLEARGIKLVVVPKALEGTKAKAIFTNETVAWALDQIVQEIS